MHVSHAGGDGAAAVARGAELHVGPMIERAGAAGAGACGGGVVFEHERPSGFRSSIGGSSKGA